MAKGGLTPGGVGTGIGVNELGYGFGLGSNLGLGLGFGTGLGLESSNATVPMVLRGEDAMATATAAYERTKSCVAFCHAPQTTVRWLRGVGGREAIAVSGSGCGDGQLDMLSFFSVWTEHDNSGMSNNHNYHLHHARRRELRHNGKVSAIDVGGDGGLVSVGSSLGGISVFRSDRWEDAALTNVGYIQQMRGRRMSDVESVVGVVSLGSDQVCAAGEYGSVCVFTVDHQQQQQSGTIGSATGSGAAEAAAAATPTVQLMQPYGEQFDGVGLQALAVVDEGAMQVVGAGLSAVTVWDVRTGGTASRFVHPTKAAATAVTVDPSQPHFVVAGFRNGEVCTWDRRMTSSSAGGPLDVDVPLSRAAVHDGPVWDLRVVSCNRPGRLITCGEDGMVLMVDYAMAVARGAAGDTAETGAGWNAMAGAVTGEFWRATIANSDVHSLIGKYKKVVGVNGVDAHSSAELFAFASDSAEVGFGILGYSNV